MSDQMVTETKLARLVKQSGLRQYQFAGACFIHPTTFSEYVRGIKPLTPDHLFNICSWLKVEPETVVGYV